MTLAIVGGYGVAPKVVASVMCLRATIVSQRDADEGVSFPDT